MKLSLNHPVGAFLSPGYHFERHGYIFNFDKYTRFWLNHMISKAYEEIIQNNYSIVELAFNA